MNYEAALITKVLETKDITKVINSKVSHCFKTHSDIYDYIQSYYLKFKAVPPLEVVQEKFPDFYPQSTEATDEFLVEEVTNDFLRFKLEDLITRAAEQIEENPREMLDYMFAKISALGHQTDVVKDVNLVDDYWIRLNSLKERVEAAEQGKDILGIPSLVTPIDYIFGGWQPGDFVVLMGWTGAGKTWLSTYLAANAWKMGKKPLYFSLEMDDKQFGYRIDTLLGEGKFSNTSLINGRKIAVESYEEWAKESFSDKNPFYIVTNEALEEVNQFTVQAKIEQYKPDIVFLDYHSLFDDAKKGRSETEKHRNLSKDFKRMAVRYGVPIIDIVAVTMEGGAHEERAPELSEVAWSKQLSYDADLVLSVFRSGQQITVEAKKSRRSDRFAFQLQWDFDSGKVFLNDW